MTGITVLFLILAVFGTCMTIFAFLWKKKARTDKIYERREFIEHMTGIVAGAMICIAIGFCLRDLSAYSIEHNFVDKGLTPCSYAENSYEVLNITSNHDSYFYTYIDKDGYLAEDELSSIRSSVRVKVTSDNSYRIEIKAEKSFSRYKVYYIIYIPKTSDLVPYSMKQEAVNK